MTHDTLSVKEAAAALGVSEQTIKRRIRAGEIKAEKVPLPGAGRYMLLINRASLEQPTQVLDVVPVQKPVPVAELQQIITNALTAENAALRHELDEIKKQLLELQGVKQELAATREVLARIDGKLSHQPPAHQEQPGLLRRIWRKVW